MIYKIFNGECIKVMDYLIENNVKVNSVICDIPYGTTACPFDEIIPFDKMWDRLYKLTYDNSPIVLFSSQPFTAKLINSNIKNFREEIIWLKNKSASGMAARQKHLKVHENIIVFARSGSYTYNPQKWEVKEKDFLTRRKTLSIYGETNNIYGKFARNRKLDDGTRNPISVIAYKIPIPPAKTKTYSDDVDIRYHPMQKPLLLMEYLVNTFSNINDIVLDFTMGAGTTGVASIKCNRRFIGIDIKKEFCDIGEQRIERVI